MLTLMLALALSGAATEAAAAPSETEAATAPEKVKPKLVCRRVPNTGTRLAQRECKSQEQWNREADSISQRLNDADKAR